MTQGDNPGDDTPARAPQPTYGLTPAGPRQTRLHPTEIVQVRRDLFWQNVVREILMGLAAAATQSSGRLTPTPTGASSSPSPVSDMFDGRMGIITSQGQRIPIADVIPVFSVSTCNHTDRGDRMLSNDVQCSVFRISTPSGESYTLPITQIVGVHSMSNALAEQLEAAARDREQTDEQGNKMPFGFGAYTALAKSESQAESKSGSDDRSESAPDDNA